TTVDVKMSQFDQIFDTPHRPGHFVQLYGSDERLLAENVARFLTEGLRRGDRLLVIATEAHAQAFYKQIQDLDAHRQQVRWLDAKEALGQFMKGGQPDWKLFKRAIGSAIGNFGGRPAGAGLGLYGEMVGILWNEGKYAAAIRLEQFWNQLLHSQPFH